MLFTRQRSHCFCVSQVSVLLPVICICMLDGFFSWFRYRNNYLIYPHRLFYNYAKVPPCVLRQPLTNLGYTPLIVVLFFCWCFLNVPCMFSARAARWLVVLSCRSCCVSSVLFFFFQGFGRGRGQPHHRPCKPGGHRQGCRRHNPFRHLPAGNPFDRCLVVRDGRNEVTQ